MSGIRDLVESDAHWESPHGVRIERPEPAIAVLGCQDHGHPVINVGQVGSGHTLERILN